MRYLIPAFALLLCHEATAQMFKCTDAAGKVTYSSTTCKELGLKDAGAVQDRIQVTPAPAQPSAAPSAPRQAPRAAQERAAERPAAAAEAATEPDRRCFTIKTAKGSATRCNDKPDDKAE
ncbi:MAG TPA: DUF4124 domain-containing protein [Burkholderiales bacterium]|nr:DUF4124 domain-containing protein [Burkholderiales bacterium]